MKKSLKKYLILLYISFIISIIGYIIINRNNILNNNPKILKEMSESTQITDLNKTIEELNSSHTDYANQIQTSKQKIAKAINMYPNNNATESNSLEEFSTMITNLTNIPENTYYYERGTEEKASNILRYKRIGEQYYICNANGIIEEGTLATDISSKTLVPYTVTTDKNLSVGFVGYASGKLHLGNGEDVNKKEYKVEKLIPQMGTESNEVGSISVSGNYNASSYPILNAFRPNDSSWISNYTRNPWIMYTWNKPVHMQATCFFTGEIYDPATIGTITVQGKRHDTGEFVTLSTATINKTNTLSRMELMFVEIDEQYLNVAFDAIKFLHDNGKSDYMQVSYINAFGYYAE